MKILFIAKGNHPHTARWIGQLKNTDFKLFFFPSHEENSLNEGFKNVTILKSFYSQERLDVSVRQSGVPVFGKRQERVGQAILQKYVPNYRIKLLAHYIRKLKPDLIHSMDIQDTAGFVLGAKDQLGMGMPRWLMTSWGSDLYLFGQFPEYLPEIKRVLAEADFFSTDCQRDLKLALELGLRGKYLGAFPSGGGFELDQTVPETRAADRRIILVKGNQGWAGRALVGIRALERTAEALKGYKVVIYSAKKEEVVIAGRLLEKRTGIETEILSGEISHREILGLQGKARVSIGLSISDGTPNTMLEAMIMGALPIQSESSAADEWIEDGKNGLLVPAEDSDKVAVAIKRALKDDKLVERAEKINREIARERLDTKKILPEVIKMYQTISPN